MTDPGSGLDSIDFERLVERARSFIPRYAPGWTDHNLADPGITLIDVLAWIVDQQIYRVGFIGDEYLKSFAALLGCRPCPPVGARGLIWPIDEATEEHGFAGFRLRADEAVICANQTDRSFLIEHEIYLTDAKLTGAELSTGDDQPSVIMTERSVGTMLLTSTVPDDDLSLVLRFDRPLAPPGHPVSIGFELVAPPGPDPEPDSAQPWLPLRFQYRQASSDWLPVELVSDGTDVLARSGVVILLLPDLSDGEQREPAATVHRPVEASELKLLLDRSYFPTVPELRHVGVNVVPVVQHEAVGRTQLAAGTDRPDQEVEFVSGDLISTGDIALRVDGEPWIEVSSLKESGPNDRHYVRHLGRTRFGVAESGWLRFGNGINGRRPAKGASISHEALRRTKGAAGNVPAGAMWSFGRADLADRVFGKNRTPVIGGIDGETIDDLLTAARGVATRRRALLTDRDLERAAMDLPGMAVSRAEVVRGVDPRLAAIHSFRQARTLIVVPYRDPKLEAREVPQQYLDLATARLNAARVIGERLTVVGPIYVEIDVQIQVVAEPGQEPVALRQSIVDRMEQRLCDLHRDGDIEPWPFGREVTVNELITLVAKTVGVSAVSTCRIGRVPTDPALASTLDTAANLDTAAIPIEPLAVAVARFIEVDVRPARRAAGAVGS